MPIDIWWGSEYLCLNGNMAKYVVKVATERPQYLGAMRTAYDLMLAGF